jgi:rubrerythrin
MGWSLTNFSGDEIIEIALQMEESGKLFYEKAFSQAEDGSLQETLKYLAQAETQHIHRFTKLGEELGHQFYPNERYVGEYGDYVKSLVNNHIFKLSEVEDILAGAKNDHDILRDAIGFEKDSIAIFQEFKNAANKEGAETLEKLINEEREHIKILGNLMKKI